MEELGENSGDTEKGGRHATDIREFLKAVVKQVLLFGAETWLVTPKMERALSAFLHGAARRLTGRQAGREKCMGCKTIIYLLN